MTSRSGGENEVAGDAFVQWASPQHGAPREVRSLVEHVDVTHDHVGLIETDLQGRRVAWKSVPAGGKAPITVPATAAAGVDPWTVDPVSLRVGSDHVAVCDACGGAGKLRCASCASTGKQSCGACGGQRKAYGYAANGAWRLLNCQACRGKGAIDCPECRRGIAVCKPCAGEGRLQRWLELESWRRSTSAIHPHTCALRFGWGESPANEIVERDAFLLAEHARLHALAGADLGDIPLQWLEVLAQPAMAEERVARQRLRIARVPTYTVHYRLGNAEDRVAFSGRRLLPPRESSPSLFLVRASKLRGLSLSFAALYGSIALVSLGRGAFFWSLATLASLVAFGSTLVAIYRAAADWTSSRRHLQKWLGIAVATLAIAIFFAFAALPQGDHADGLIAAGKLDDAETELEALRSRADVRSWADLRLARIRQATDVGSARKELAQISRELPQYAEATDAIDRMVMAAARDAATRQRWADAVEVLGQLSPRARGTQESIAAAIDVHIPLARERIARTHWSEAADAIVAAKRLGAPAGAWEPLADSIRIAGLSAVASAKYERNPRSRFGKQLAAEEILVAWEQASGRWGTPPLIALRAAMARDLDALERGNRLRAQ